jgi:hypothetical protein
VHEINCHSASLTPRGVEKSILDVLRRSLCVHDLLQSNLPMGD